LAINEYNKNEVNEWISKNHPIKRDSGYEFNYLIHTCLKEDNPKFYEKNFKPKIEFIEETDEAEQRVLIELYNDVQAADEVLKRFQSYYIICDKIKYVKMSCNLWTTDKEEIKKVIWEHIISLNIGSIVKDNVFIKYNKTIKNIKSCYEYILYINSWFY
jgi:hypothetical protein